MLNKIQTVRSRVARRIFILFVFCALIPILTLSAIAYQQVSAQLRKSIDRQLSSLAKSYGMELLGRMQTLQSELEDSESIQQLRFGGDVSDRSHWNSWSLIAFPTNSTAEAHPELASFTAEQRAALEKGKTVLISRPQPIFFRYLGTQGTDQLVVAAKPNSDYLFGTEEDFLEGITILRDASGQTVFSSSPLERLSTPPQLDSISGRFRTKLNGRQAEGAYWKLFLRAEFNAESWTVLTVADSAMLWKPISTFRKTFPWVLLLALCVVVLLSSIQIRRTLVPLERLTEVAKKLQDRDFGAVVRIDSNDEFQDLAEVINQMAEKLGAQFTTLQRVHWGTLTALARAIDAKSAWTAGHSERVTNLALKIASAMGLPISELEVLQRGGLLHDIGKIGTPPEILDKAGPLTHEQMSVMRGHVLTGVRILEPIPDFKSALSVVAQHHECLDGTGYPYGLAGDQICMNARILAVADCYDALISDRPYRAGLKREAVMGILLEGRGTKFDASVIDTCLEITESEQTTSCTGSSSHEERPLCVEAN